LIPVESMSANLKCLFNLFKVTTLVLSETSQHQWGQRMQTASLLFNSILLAENMKDLDFYKFNFDLRVEAFSKLAFKPDSNELIDEGNKIVDYVNKLFPSTTRRSVREQQKEKEEAAQDGNEKKVEENDQGVQGAELENVSLDEQELLETFNKRVSATSVQLIEAITNTNGDRFLVDAEKLWGFVSKISNKNFLHAFRIYVTRVLTQLSKSILTRVAADIEKEEYVPNIEDKAALIFLTDQNLESAQTLTGKDLLAAFNEVDLSLAETIKSPQVKKFLRSYNKKNEVTAWYQDYSASRKALRDSIEDPLEETVHGIQNDEEVQANKKVQPRTPKRKRGHNGASDGEPSTQKPKRPRKRVNEDCDLEESEDEQLESQFRHAIEKNQDSDDEAEEDEEEDEEEEEEEGGSSSQNRVQKKKTKATPKGKEKSPERPIPYKNMALTELRYKHENRNRPERRKFFSEQETEQLIAGLRKHGVGKWKAIYDDPEFDFAHRLPLDLKDKFRNLKNKNRIPDDILRDNGLLD